MAIDSSQLLVVGKITTVYGVKGWVKLHSYTEPMENILGYDSCYIQFNGSWQPLELEAAKHHGKGLIAKIKGVEDREQARVYCQCEIAVDKEDMPLLDDEEFYWYQLVGLSVFTEAAEGGQVLLGKVQQMMETGANDVLVVQSAQGSIDRRERLIPWLPDQVIKQVDIENDRIIVDWDPEF